MSRRRARSPTRVPATRTTREAKSADAPVGDRALAGSAPAPRPWIVRNARTTSLFLYIPLAVALLPALTRHLARDVATGDGWGDSYQNLWNLWWVGHALARGQDLYRTDLLYWPEGTSLLFHTLTPANGLLSLPVQLLVPGVAGLVASLNLLTLASFALTGVAAHLIARDHGASELGAWVAGFLAMSLPYRFWHLNHLNLLSTQWVLFTLLFLDRALVRRSLTAAVAAGACAALTTYSDYECAVYTALAALVLIACRFAALRSRRDALRMLVGLAVCASVAFVLHVPLARALLAQRADPVVLPSPLEADTLSANLLGFILPAPLSFLHQGWSVGYLPHNGLSGDEVSLGPLFVVAFVIMAVRRARRTVWLWTVLGILFLTLALGPSLQIGTAKLFAGEMPYAWLTTVLPFLGMGRSPVRMGCMGAIFLAIAFGLMIGEPSSAPAQRGRAGWSRARLLEMGLMALLVLERYPRTPPAMEQARVPAFYEKLSVEPDAFAVMPTPVGYYHQQVYMFWQTVHGKPLTSPGGARPNARNGRWLATYHHAPDETARLALLRAAQVRYIVQHPAVRERLFQEEPRVTVVPPAPQ